MADLWELRVRLEIDERDALLVSPGAAAEVTDYALGDRRVPCTVLQVVQRATSKRSQRDRPGERFDVRVVEVVLRLPEDSGLLPGMRVLGFVTKRQELGGANKAE